jgi:3-hydroxyisobutyrate dehydrogenase-like beta-hydroxyacid dehydrogenase
MSGATATTAPIGLIGLGLLGTALGERLLLSGRAVHVFNRTPAKAEPLIRLGAQWSDNPFATCSCVVACLYATANVVEVLDAFAAALRPGHTLIDCTTGDPAETATLGGRLEDQGVAYLEFPIAASSAQTRRGEALGLAGGRESAYAAQRELLETLAPRTVYVGPWGAAAKIKLVNNLVLGLNRVALAEGLLFARALGLDAGRTLEVLSAGNAYSKAMDVKGRKMVEEDFAVEAKLSQHLKDVQLMLEQARDCGLRLPATELHRKLLQHGETAGWGDADNASIIRAIASYPEDV